MDNPLPENDVFFKAKSAAIRILALKPKSTEELKKKLIEKGYDLQTVGRVVELLTKNGLLNDEKLARLVVSSAIYSAPVGRIKIEESLRKKGLSKEEIKKALGEASDYDEKRAARELVDKRFLKVTGLSKEKRKARIFGFLKRKGFSSDAIFSAMNGYFKDFEDNFSNENE